MYRNLGLEIGDGDRPGRRWPDLEIEELQIGRSGRSRVRDLKREKRVRGRRGKDRELEEEEEGRRAGRVELENDESPCRNWVTLAVNRLELSNEFRDLWLNSWEPNDPQGKFESE